MPTQQQGLNSINAYIIATQRHINILNRRVNNLENDVSKISIIADNNVEYVGQWNALSNNPPFGNGGVGGKQGDMYDVIVAGNTVIDGNGQWAVGDFILHNGTIWQKINNAGGGSSSDVLSVNSKIGHVVITQDDIGLGNVTNESKQQILDNPVLTGITTTQNKVDDIQIYTGAGFYYDLSIDGKLNNIIYNTSPSIVMLPLNPLNGFTLRIINYGSGHVSVSAPSPNKIENFAIGYNIKLTKILDKITLLFVNGIWNII